jgi:hypothetical protein
MGKIKIQGKSFQFKQEVKLFDINLNAALNRQVGLSRSIAVGDQPLEPITEAFRFEILFS